MTKISKIPGGLMKRLILFSHLLESVLQDVLPLIFPENLPAKTFACMPCDGLPLKGSRYELFVSSWSAIAQQHQAKSVFIDNAGEARHEERDKLLQANILLITGGNVCALLRNLRRSGLDQAILEFVQKEDYVLAGYSAGAMIMTPTIELAAVDPFVNENEDVGLTDFAALNLVDFEILPHYDETRKSFLEHYRAQTPYKVKILRDDEYLVIER
jgi:peptidase E